MQECPTGVAPDTYVFYGRLSDPFKHMRYSTVMDIVKNGAKAAGRTKTVTPHTFRYTHITDLMREGVTRTND